MMNTRKQHSDYTIIIEKDVEVFTLKVNNKLYNGYILINAESDDDFWTAHLVKEVIYG